MLKFTSVSGSVRAITGYYPYGYYYPYRYYARPIIDPITGRTTGTVAIVITAIIIVILSLPVLV
jgi:hypothetical protein